MRFQVKGHGHRGHYKFLSCPLCGSVPIWPICFILSTNIVHDDDMSPSITVHNTLSSNDYLTMCCAPFSGQKVEVTQFVWSFCCVHYMAPSLFDRSTADVVHTQAMRWRCVAHHFQVKRSKAKVKEVIESFAIFALWLSLFDRFTSYKEHTQPMRWRRVLCHFPVKRPRSKASFRIFAMSVCGSVPIWPIHVKCGTYTTNEGMMCHAPFPCQKVKGQAHTGRSYVNCRPLAAKGCRSY